MKKVYYILKNGNTNRFWADNHWEDKASLAKKYENFDTAKYICDTIRAFGTECTIVEVTISIDIKEIRNENNSLKSGEISLDSIENAETNSESENNLDGIIYFCNKYGRAYDLVGHCNFPQDLLHADEITDKIRKYCKSKGREAGIVSMSEVKYNSVIYASASGCSDLGTFMIHRNQ